MKLYFIPLALVFFITNFSFAQQDEKKENSWGCSFSINSVHSQRSPLAAASLQVDAEGNMLSGGKKTEGSFSFSIIPKYSINNKLKIRLEYGFTRIDLKRFNSTSTSGYYASSSYGITNDTVDQKIHRFVPGLQSVFLKSKKIQFYAGVILPFAKYGNILHNTYTEVRNVATDTLIQAQKSYSQIKGGFSVGIGVTGGLSYYLLKNLSLGAEFSSALQYYKTGGTATGTDSIQMPDGSWQETTYSSFESYRGTRFTKILSSFNVSIWL
jgi:hypothetical protein